MTIRELCAQVDIEVPAEAFVGDYLVLVDNEALVPTAGIDFAGKIIYLQTKKVTQLLPSKTQES